MSERNDGGPAYPTNEERNLYDESIMVSAQPGMSLRDWFAGQALDSLVCTLCLPDEHLEDSDAERVAKSAYKIADAMLKAREET